MAGDYKIRLKGRDGDAEEEWETRIFIEDDE